MIHLLTFPSSLPFVDLPGFSAQSSLLPHPQQEKQTIFFHLYAFTWLLLVLSTVGITRVQPGIGGGYLFSVWNALVAVSCVFVGIEGLLTPTEAQNVPEELPVEELSGDEGEEYDNGIPRGSHRNVEDANEVTPLIWREGREGTARSARRILSPVELGHAEEETEAEGSAARTLATWWWILQFVVSVPIPVVLFGQVTMLLLDSVPQTLADGGSARLGEECLPVPNQFLTRHYFRSSIRTDICPRCSTRSSAGAVRSKASAVPSVLAFRLSPFRCIDSLRHVQVPILHKCPTESIFPSNRQLFWTIRGLLSRHSSIASSRHRAHGCEGLSPDAPYSLSPFCSRQKVELQRGKVQARADHLRVGNEAHALSRFILVVH